MGEGRDDAVLARLEGIEGRLDALIERIDRVGLSAPPQVSTPVARSPRLEPVVAKPAEPVVAPLFERPTAPREVDPLWNQWEHVRAEKATAKVEARPAAPPVPEPKRASADDIEYRIGVTGLVRGGAAVFVIGLLYLVALSISRGYISPPVQFVGEILLCLGFLGFGYRRRHEGEEFGGLMMGIGACGLYATFAGGHVFKRLYEGETVVGLFLVLSFLYLGYGTWRASRSFWTIGVVGGLAAAVLPALKDRGIVALALHLLVVVPAAIIAVRQKWIAQTYLLTAVAGAAIVPALLLPTPWILRVGAMDLAALVLAWALAHVPERGLPAYGEHNPLNVVRGGLFAVAAAGLLFQLGQAGTLGIVTFAAAIAGTAFLFARDTPAHRAFLGIAAVVLVVLSPAALTPVGAAFVYGGFALGIAGLAIRGVPTERFPASAVALGWTAYGLALGAGGIAVLGPGGLVPRLEAPLLVLGIAAVAANALATRTIPRTVERLGLTEFVVGVPGLLIGAAFLRLTHLAADGFGTGTSATANAAVGALAFSAACSLVAARARWAPAAFLGAIFAAVGVAATLGVAKGDWAAPGTRFEVGLLLAAMVTTLLAALAVGRVSEERAGLTGIAVLALWALLSRAVYVGVALASTLRGGSWGLTFAWIAFAAALVGIGFGREARYLRYWGFGVFAATVAKVFLLDLAELDPAVRVTILLALGLAMIACGHRYIRNRGATSPPEVPTSSPS